MIQLRFRYDHSDTLNFSTCTNLHMIEKLYYQYSIKIPKQKQTINYR